MRIERTKLSRKILYHFAIFAIINEKLITKDHRKHCKRAARYDRLQRSWLLGARRIVFYKWQRATRATTCEQRVAGIQWL